MLRRLSPLRTLALLAILTFAGAILPSSASSGTFEWNEGSQISGTTWQNEVWGKTRCVEYYRPATPANTISVGCFKWYGDDLYVVDHEADGKSAVLYWKLDNGARSGVCRNRFGKGNFARCFKDMPEERSIFIQAGVWNGGTKTKSRLTLSQGCWWTVDIGRPDPPCDGPYPQ